jgi:hypothetical protein
MRTDSAQPNTNPSEPATATGYPALPLRRDLTAHQSKTLGRTRWPHILRLICPTHTTNVRPIGVKTNAGISSGVDQKARKPAFSEKPVITMQTGMTTAAHINHAPKYRSDQKAINLKTACGSIIGTAPYPATQCVPTKTGRPRPCAAHIT